MWLIPRYRLSTFCILLLLLLLLIVLFYIKFSDKQFTNTLPIKLFEISITAENSSTEYLRVQLDLASNQAICQADDLLIVYILSAITNFRRRDVIRSTWASKQNGTCFVFIIGEVSGTTPDAGELQMRITNERRQYQDLIQINHVETYANVVYKEVAALQWSYQFYRNISYLFKADDDLIVDTLLLAFMARLLHTNVSDKNSLIGKYNPLLVSSLMSADRTTFFRSAWPIDLQPTARGSGKFGVKESIWPHEFLPPYCSGFGWFMSKNIRDKLVIASNKYPLSQVIWIGDVFASGLLARAANVKCTRMPLEYDQSLFGNCSCSMANNPLLAVCSSSFHASVNRLEAQKYNEYRNSWNAIQLRHNPGLMITVDC